MWAFLEHWRLNHTISTELSKIKTFRHVLHISGEMFRQCSTSNLRWQLRATAHRPLDEPKNSPPGLRSNRAPEASYQRIPSSELSHCWRCLWAVFGSAWGLLAEKVKGARQFQWQKQSDEKVDKFRKLINGSCQTMLWIPWRTWFQRESRESLVGVGTTKFWTLSLVTMGLSLEVAFQGTSQVLVLKSV